MIISVLLTWKTILSNYKSEDLHIGVLSVGPKQEENQLQVYLFPDPGPTFHKHSRGSEDKGKIAREFILDGGKKPFLKTL